MKPIRYCVILLSLNLLFCNSEDHNSQKADTGFIQLMSLLFYWHFRLVMRGFRNELQHVL